MTVAKQSRFFQHVAARFMSRPRMLASRCEKRPAGTSQRGEKIQTDGIDLLRSRFGCLGRPEPDVYFAESPIRAISVSARMRARRACWGTSGSSRSSVAIIRSPPSLVVSVLISGGSLTPAASGAERYANQGIWKMDSGNVGSAGSSVVFSANSLLRCRRGPLRFLNETLARRPTAVARSH